MSIARHGDARTAGAPIKRVATVSNGASITSNQEECKDTSVGSIKESRVGWVEERERDRVRRQLVKRQEMAWSLPSA